MGEGGRGGGGEWPPSLLTSFAPNPSLSPKKFGLRMSMLSILIRVGYMYFFFFMLFNPIQNIIVYHLLN